jgi:DNA modification methylase
MGRHSVGIDILPEYCEMAQESVKSVQHCLFEEDFEYGNNQEVTVQGVYEHTAHGNKP